MAMIANLHSAPCKHAYLSNIERTLYQVNSYVCYLFSKAHLKYERRSRESLYKESCGVFKFCYISFERVRLKLLKSRVRLTFRTSHLLLV